MKGLMLATFCLLAIATSAHAKSEIWLTGTFSSLRFNTEGRDLLGVELTIVPTRKGYQGALQIAEGGPSEIMVVDIQLRKNNTIRFNTPVSYPFYGGGTFEGMVDSKGTKGRFTFVGATGDPERLVRGGVIGIRLGDPGDVDKSSVVSHSSPRHSGPEEAASRLGLRPPPPQDLLERCSDRGIELVPAGEHPQRWAREILHAQPGLLGAGRHRLARLRWERGQPDPQRQQPSLQILGRPQEALPAGAVRAPVLQLLPEGGDLQRQLGQFQL